MTLNLDSRKRVACVCMQWLTVVNEDDMTTVTHPGSYGHVYTFRYPLYGPLDNEGSEVLCKWLDSIHLDITVQQQASNASKPAPPHYEGRMTHGH